MISSPKQFDWNSIKQSLRDGEAVLDRAWVADEKQLNQVYRQRQLDYAHRKTLEVAVTETLRVLVFVLARNDTPSNCRQSSRCFRCRNARRFQAIRKRSWVLST